MKYLAVLGRQPEISIAELEALFGKVERIATELAVFVADSVDVNRLGGVLKVAKKMEVGPIELFKDLPAGKITLGVSDYSKQADKKSAQAAALKLKKILVRHGRSVRVVENKAATLSTATSLHNGLFGDNVHKAELIKVNDDDWYLVVGVQNIEAYARRDQARPARDARVGMLPPKLAQILINLGGLLEPGATVLDPFCGTGVVLQEAILMGYDAYGTDIDKRMVEYSKRNLDYFGFKNYRLEVGDATTHRWTKKIDSVACEGYLGKPFSRVPSGLELKAQKQDCGAIVIGFLQNLVGQIESATSVVIAVPAWRREDGSYERLDMLDEIDKLGYNVDNKSREGLLYYRPEQVVARDIIILRKK
ncbi:methyltransferase domain-containing protein [Candidatus Saccharibacteria bacterium]|nr:methyltransferase domain-containing protein [Candidatus Saccharibacteria bacterium]